MLKLAVCDDERVFRSDLRKIISTELDLCGIDYQILEFTCGEELLDSLDNADYQIIFLDIEMTALDGISTAKELRSRKSCGEIIFVTSHPDFVFQGYEVRALNYIMKPYEREKIIAVLNTALEVQDITMEKYYVIEQQGKSIRVPLSSVKYFTSDKRIVHAVTSEKRYSFYEKLSELESQLPESFIRIHSRYLINLRYLAELKGNSVLVDGEPLPVSRSCKPELSIAFAKFMLH